MSGNQLAHLNVNEEIIEMIRCCNCKAYLTTGPIHVQAEGGNLCDSCSSVQQVSEYRQLALEVILQGAFFQCQNEKYGCSADSIAFDLIKKHEEDCKYRPFMCGSLTNIVCPWQGSAKQFAEHVSSEHGDLFNESRRSFNADKHVLVKIMAVKDEYGNVVIFEYSYDANNSEVTCMGGLLPTDEKNRGKMKLNDYFEIEIPSYDCSKYGLKALPGFSLSPYLQNNKNTTCTFKWVPFSPKTDLVAQKYTCRWRGCTWRTIKSNIPHHENSCKHRKYSCMYPGCTVVLDGRMLSDHMISHQCMPFILEHQYTINFNNTLSKPLYMFSIIENEMFLLLSYMLNNKYVLLIESSNYYHQNFSVRVRFTHGRILVCKSKKFFTSDKLEILVDQLKPCCRTVDLTVNVKIK